jgi:hypothetical protein
MTQLEGTLASNGSSEQPQRVESCPDCGTATTNVQGMTDCPDCGWMPQRSR